MLIARTVSDMYTTRKTIHTARLVAILTAVSTYLLAGLFFNLLVVTGTAAWLGVVLAVAGTVWLTDAYTTRRSVDSPLADYRIRIALLGAAYGLGTAGLALGIVNYA